MNVACPFRSIVTPEPTFISPPVTSIPSLAVIIPTESMFLTSSYVNVPPIETSPLNDPVVAFNGPLKLEAVIIPDEFIFLDVISPVVI